MRFFIKALRTFLPAAERGSIARADLPDCGESRPVSRSRIRDRVFTQSLSTP